MGPPSTHPHSPTLATHLRLLLDSSHILHNHSCLDAYGHISFRNPANPSKFLMPRNLAPGLLSCPADIVEYNVEDASPVLGDKAPRGYTERYIHSEVYKKWSGVGAVVHSHDGEVVPWTLMGNSEEKVEGLGAVCHMAGFLGTRVLNWDIADEYAKGGREDLKEGDVEDVESLEVWDMLVNSVPLGASLAEAFHEKSKTKSTSKSKSQSKDVGGDSEAFPDHRVTLMRGHGYTAVAEDLQTVVFQAIYTQFNAQTQAKALALAANMGLNDPQKAVKRLSGREAKGSEVFNLRTKDRPWALWVEECRVSGLYRNELDVDEVRKGGEVEGETSKQKEVQEQEEEEQKGVEWMGHDVKGIVPEQDELVWRSGSLVPKGST